MFPNPNLDLLLALLAIPFPTTLSFPAPFPSQNTNITTPAATTTSPSFDLLAANPGQISLAFSTTAEYVEIPGKVFARDYFWAIWNRRSDHTCNKTPYQLNDGEGSPGCTITFQCHGNSRDAWAATNGLAETLIGIVAEQKGVQEHTSRTERVCTGSCEDGHGSTRCCQWESHERWTMKMARMIEIYTRNVDAESDYGALRYTLNRPIRESPMCRVAKVFANALSVFAQGMGDALGAPRSNSYDLQ